MICFVDGEVYYPFHFGAIGKRGLGSFCSMLSDVHARPRCCRILFAGATAGAVNRNRSNREARKSRQAGVGARSKVLSAGNYDPRCTWAARSLARHPVRMTKGSAGAPHARQEADCTSHQSVLYSRSRRALQRRQTVRSRKSSNLSLLPDGQ